MITIICATNRPKNLTWLVVELYEKLLKVSGEEVRIFSMDELPENFTVTDSYGNRSEEVAEILKSKIEPASRLIVIAPEYNGSYPGVFKAFLDGVPPRIWVGKKAALVGVATGRAGNLRGLDHLTDVLHHLKIEVFSGKIPISRLDSLLDENDQLNDEATIKVLENQIEKFLQF